ncbi:MAG: tetratricopeptide repeat protein, partial [Planctomycetota bacterium]
LNDPELASLRVERVLARYPRHREALALRCTVAATRYDFGLLEEELSAFDRLSPGHPLALFEAGSALSERRQYKEASAYLNRAIERAPNWAEPLVELGLMEVQAARDVIAKDALERAVALDPFHTRAKNSLALVEGLLAEFATMESEHFVVRYQPGPDEVLAREMLVELEAMHDELVEVLEHTPARKTLMELMPTHDWFSVRITGMPQIHTVAAATGPIIAMEAPKVGKGHTGVYDWLRVARHEYAHTITLDRTGNRIPLWFTEAAAVAMEDAPRDYNRVRLLSSRLASNELFDLEEIDLGFIRPEKQSDRAQAYAQAQWIWEFIDETWGGPANLEMMDRFARGERVPGVLDEMFGLTQRAFMSRFTEWAWEDARTWGVFAEPSLDALRMEETLADPELGPDAIGDLRRFARSVTRASATGARVERFDPQLITVTPELVGFWSELHPDHPDVLELRVDAMLDSRSDGPTMDDAELLRAYARARPTDPKPHRHLARLFLRSDDPARAIPHLEFLDDREIYSPAYAVALARRYAERADYDRALASARKAVRVSPFDGDYRELAATVAIRAERFDEARHHLEALTVLEPTIEQHKRRLEALDRLATRPG